MDMINEEEKHFHKTLSGKGQVVVELKKFSKGENKSLLLCKEESSYLCMKNQSSVALHLEDIKQDNNIISKFNIIEAKVMSKKERKQVSYDGFPRQADTAQSCMSAVDLIIFYRAFSNVNVLYTTSGHLNCEFS